MDKTLFPLAEPGGGKPEPRVKGVPRLVRPNRSQLELRSSDLESLIGASHPVRSVWDFVESLDVEPLYEQVEALEGSAGRPAIDPRIHMALWLYATVEGIGSARELERLTERDDVYRWICGGVSVNHHSLSDFRVQQAEYLDAVLTKSVAVLMAKGLVTLKRVAHDGLRVRSSAGGGSFRTKLTLTKALRQAEQQVQRLRQELAQDAQATSRRQQAAQQRAAEQRRSRVAEAIEEMRRLEAQREAQKKRKRKQEKPLRASMTDAQARVMKMADGGFRPAYNAQLCVDVASQIVVGVELSNRGSDRDQLRPMVEQLGRRYGLGPAEVLVDGGFAGLRDVEQVSALGATVYAPLPPPKNAKRDPHVPLRGDSPAIAQWRQRMGTAEAQQIYRERAASVECVNALCRQRGLQQFPVRGQIKARAVLLWYAIAHNVMRALSLPQPATALA